MLRNYEEPFEMSRDALYDSLVRYVRSKPQHYTGIVEDRAAYELRTKLVGAYFAYNADVRFAITARGQGSALAIQVKTHWLFFMDPMDFWGRYCRRVTAALRNEASAA